MLVHLLVMCFYKSLVSKSICPCYCFSQNHFFFLHLHAAEEFGREALGKPGEETGKSLPRLPYEIMKRRSNIAFPGYNLD